MSKTINKSDLVRDLSKASGQSQSAVSDLIDAFLSAVKDHTDAGLTVSVAGFGKFATKVRAARTGRNPRTGEAVEIAASSALGFKPSKAK